METMFDRIRRMTKSEMKQFVYWVYLCGNRDGKDSCEDSPGDCSYFGGGMLTKESKEVMPHDNVQDLWDNFQKTYESNIWDLPF